MSGTNLVIIDTNIIIRFLMADHPDHYQETRQFFADVENRKKAGVLLESVFAEVVFVLEKFYKVSRPEIIELLEKIIDLKNIKITSKPILKRALAIYKSRKMDIVDCIICAYSLQTGTDVFSFDKGIKKVVG